MNLVYVKHSLVSFFSRLKSTNKTLLRFYFYRGKSIKAVVETIEEQTCLKRAAGSIRRRFLIYNFVCCNIWNIFDSYNPSLYPLVGCYCVMWLLLLGCYDTETLLGSYSDVGCGCYGILFICKMSFSVSTCIREMGRAGPSNREPSNSSSWINCIHVHIQDRFRM